MSRLRVITACDPLLLLRHAASGFLQPRIATAAVPYPTVEYLLCLRQGGLRDDMIRMAGDAGVRGWFDTPLCTLQELPEWLGVIAPSAVNEYERRVILSEILRDHSDATFARGARAMEFAGDIDVLIGELISEGIDVDTLERALQSTAVLASCDPFEATRDADFLSIYRAYSDMLTHLVRADGRDALSYAAQAIIGGQAALGERLRGRREIRIYGLADLRGGWRALLAALASSPDLDQVVIYTSAELDFGDLVVQREQLKETSTAASRLFIEAPTNVDASVRGSDPGPARVGMTQPGHERSAVTHIVAPDLERELDTVASQIRALINQGTPPHRIAIVARSARPHVDQAISALKKVGVPATARQRLGLREVPVVRAMSTVLTAAAEGWTRYGLSHVVRSPYIECDVDPRILDFIGYRRRVTGLGQWVQALENLQAQAQAEEAAARERIQSQATARTKDAESPRARLPGPGEIGHARDCFAHFVSRAEVLDTPKPLAAWLTWVEDFLEGDAWGISKRLRQLVGDRFDIIRRDLLASVTLSDIAREWREAVVAHSGDNAVLTASEFARTLAPSLDGDLAFWSETAHGVQVLEASAAAYRSFAHVFVIGMEAGAFPNAPPGSPIWSEGDREALRNAGLPLDGRDAWERREQELFRVIAAGTQHLTVSHARLDATGREVIGSVFVEELADVTSVTTIDVPTSQVTVLGVPLYSSPTAPNRAVHAARIERIRALRSTSAYNGAVTHPDLLTWLAEDFGDNRLWSPTQLEEFAKCPWAYLSKRLMRLERFEDPDEEMDPSMRGTVLHDALARFYSDAAIITKGPVFLLPGDWVWAEGLLATSLDNALVRQRDNWTGHPALHTAKHAQLQRTLNAFICWEMDLHHDMTDPKTRKRNAPKMVRTAVTEHEVSFDEMVFERDGVRIRYRGTIDRIEVSVDERIPEVKLIAAVDYKSTKYSTPGAGEKRAWDEGVVLQVPLYAYALAQLRPGYEVARVEYLALSHPEPVHSLQLYTVDKQSSTLEQDDDAVAKWQAALDHAVGHVKQARRGEFPAKPPVSCGCPPWCHGRDICRVPRSSEAQ